ncbi:gastrin/cholecystokinin type B receptor [Aplysia californica]|uniref:Gastrin/cholecystokinin type B receptor n=1 Tax=Aplysia californica TaxID=6500 RepID=A0ABM1A102_APLCA|nr:gastrin/cholecystokinin type B receptor [Aplysia californica]XP_035825957.1 gastrin/cholecystokinin type B receptor [Aplysia californica]
MDILDFKDLNMSNNTSLRELFKHYETYDGINDTHNIVLIVLYVPVFLVAVIGNIIVLLVILTDAHMRKSSANYFLVNLSMADLLVAIICIPITALGYVYNVWVVGGTAMCKVTAYMQGTCIVASVLTIVLMSIDRYCAIRHPMKHRHIFRVSRVRRLIVFTWMSAAVVVLPIALVTEVESPEFGIHDEFCTELWPFHTLRQAYGVAFLVGMYLVPGGAIVVLYTLMGCRLWARDTHLHRQNSIRNQDDVLVARRRLALMMIIVSVLFTACWLPYYIFNICFDFEADSSGQLITLYPFTLLLGHSNSAQNPVLYCFMHKSFRAFILRLIKCQCRTVRRMKRGTMSRTDSREGSLRHTSYKMIGRGSSLKTPVVKQANVIKCANETTAILGGSAIDNV